MSYNNKYSVKAAVKSIAVALFLSLAFAGCNNDDNNGGNTSEERQITYPKTQTYVISDINNQIWSDTILGTCYAKIPEYDNPAWFDVVMATEDINSSETKLIRKYIYIHCKNQTAVKSFSFDNERTFSGGFNIIYYENKTTNTDYPEFSLCLTDPKGNLVITENDGEYISGCFKGTLTNAVDTKDKKNVSIQFNKIPISLAK